MSYQTSERYNCVVIQFKGNVMGGPDAVNLNEELHALIDVNKTNVIVYLSKVKFMNSSGLGMLIGGLTTMKNPEATSVLPMQPIKLKACWWSPNSSPFLNIFVQWMRR